MPTIDEIRKQLIQAVNKAGEGTKIGTRKTYYEQTGHRLFDARTDTFKKANKSCSDIYYLQTTDQQIDAYYINGQIVINKSGFDRHQSDILIDKAEKECKRLRRK